MPQGGIGLASREEIDIEGDDMSTTMTKPRAPWLSPQQTAASIEDLIPDGFMIVATKRAVIGGAEGWIFCMRGGQAELDKARSKGAVTTAQGYPGGIPTLYAKLVR